MGATPSTLSGDLDSTLLIPGENLPSSLGVLDPSTGVCLSLMGVSDLLVVGEAGALELESQGNLPEAAAEPNTDCSKFFLHDVNISSLKPAKPGADWFCCDPENIICYNWNPISVSKK